MEYSHLLPIALLFCCISNGQAIQKTNAIPIPLSSVNATGGDAISDEGSVAYSIGAVFHTTITDTENHVAQGIQHAVAVESLETIASIEPSDELLAQVMAYPNPTLDYLIIDVFDFEEEDAQYQLFDSRGDIIEKNSITGRITELSMGHMSAATYFLKISVFKKFVKTLKIIKR